MSELESEIKRHRERTISLLSEKDQEIHDMRSSLPHKYNAFYGSSRQKLISRSSSDDNTDHENGVVEMLTKNSMSGKKDCNVKIVVLTMERVKIYL